MWSDIDEFTEWYQKNGYPMRPPSEDPIYVTDHSLSAITFRQGRYQVETYFLAPNWETPNHEHPDIEYRIIYLNGTLTGTKNKEKLVDTPDYFYADMKKEDGTNVGFGTVWDFSGSDQHTVKTGPRGGLIAITQYWPEHLTMSSQSVHYVGDPIGPEHATKIKV
jgi:hypothetical protein